jgi:hypothetical protein
MYRKPELLSSPKGDGIGFRDLSRSSELVAIHSIFLTVSKGRKVERLKGGKAGLNAGQKAG